LRSLAVYLVSHRLKRHLYRPGSLAAPALFFKTFIGLLEIVTLYSCPIVISGDFNIHVNAMTDRCAQQFAEIIESFDLVQAVSVPTHHEGNTLDLVITRSDTQPIDGDVLPHDMIANHALVVCRFASASFAVPQYIRYLRHWSEMDRVAFVASTARRYCVQTLMISGKCLLMT
jgi:Endonuclease-reverse transcriptase